MKYAIFNKNFSPLILSDKNDPLLSEVLKRIAKGWYIKEIKELPDNIRTEIDEIKTEDELFKVIGEKVGDNYLIFLKPMIKGSYFESIFFSEKAGVSLIDKNFNIKIANPFAKRMYGEDIEGKKCYEVYQKRSYVCPFCPVKVSMYEKRHYFFVVPYPDENRPKGWLALSAYPVLDDRGEVKEVVETWEDLTPYKDRICDPFVSKNVEELSRSFERLLHRINNILTVLIGNIELAQKDIMYSNLKSLRDRFIKIEKAILDIKENVSIFRDVVSKRELLPEVFPLDTVIFESLCALRSRIKEDVKIEVNQKGRWIIEGEKRRIKEAITNVLINSVEALGEEKSIRINIEKKILDKPIKGILRTIPEGEYILCEIIDRGMGMDKDTVKMVFDPFFTTKRDKEKRGLGLTITYMAIRDSGGYIDIESELRKGTKFKIYLKVLPFKKRRGPILFVDDETELLNLIKTTLSDYEVYTAKSGEEAIEICKKIGDNISVAFVDVIMPGMDGLTTQREIKKICKDLPIFIMSGTSELDKVKEMKKSGARAFITKPFKFEDLSLIVEHLVET